MWGAAALRGAVNLALLPSEVGALGVRAASVLFSDRRAGQAIGSIDRGADQNEGLKGTLAAAQHSNVKAALLVRATWAAPPPGSVAAATDQVQTFRYPGSSKFPIIMIKSSKP